MYKITDYKKILAYRVLAAGLGLLGLASPGHSQVAVDRQTHYLEAFTVSANRHESPVQQVGSTVDVLDSYELRDGEDVFLVDALREVPGLVLRNNGGPGGVFGMTTRGLSANRPIVFLNGIEVSNPSDGGIMNLGNLFTNLADRVEVLRGPQSSLYGADALAGVIAIDTLGVSSDPGGRAFVGYGSHQTYDYGLGHTGSLGAFSWSVDGRAHESEGFSAEDPTHGPAWADDDGYDNTTLSSAIAYHVSEDLSFHASGLYLDTYAEYDPGDPAWVWGVPASDNNYTTEQLFLRVGSDFKVSESWSASANLAYSDVETISYSDGSSYEASGRRFKYDWVNSVETSENWTVVAGVEYEREENLSELGERDDTSVFIENVLRFGDQLDVTLGGRYDDNSAYGEEFTYRATFSYRIEALDARVRGSLGSSFQAPTFYQLFNQWYGNEDLKAEFGKGWDVGFEKAFWDRKLQASTTLFGNRVSDKIDWDGVFKNLSTYQSVGLENALRYYHSNALSFKVAYTYSDAEENGMVEALRVPRNVLSLGSHWRGFEGRVGINLSALLVSSQYSDGGARFAGARLAGYEVVNLAASYQLDERSSLWLRLGNVLNSEYEEISGYQTAGFTLNGGLRWRF